MDRIKKVANWCLERGISVFPVRRDSKLPAIKWAKCCTQLLPSWDYPGCNIAIVTGPINELVIVDFDGDDWLEWQKKPGTFTPIRVKSRRGMHYWYKYPKKLIKSDTQIECEGLRYDVKGDRSCCTMPPSFIGGHQYSFWPTRTNPKARFIHPSKLPLFNPDWRPERICSHYSWGEDVRNWELYLSKIFTEEGNRDSTTFRLASKMKQGNIPLPKAVALLTQWHMENVTPPWGAAEIFRKVSGVYDRRG